MESIIGSIITGILALAGVIYTSRKSHETTISEIKSSLNVTKVEMKGSVDLVKKDVSNLQSELLALDSHVKEHNNMVTRMYEVEKGVEILDDRLKVANHRIKDLENIERGDTNAR